MKNLKHLMFRWLPLSKNKPPDWWRKHCHDIADNVIVQGLRKRNNVRKRLFRLCECATDLVASFSSGKLSLPGKSLLLLSFMNNCHKLKTTRPLVATGLFVQLFVAVTDSHQSVFRILPTTDFPLPLSTITSQSITHFTTIILTPTTPFSLLTATW